MMCYMDFKQEQQVRFKADGRIGLVTHRMKSGRWFVAFDLARADVGGSRLCRTDELEPVSQEGLEPPASDM